MEGSKGTLGRRLLETETHREPIVSSSELLHGSPPYSL